MEKEVKEEAGDKDDEEEEEEAVEEGWSVNVDVDVDVEAMASSLMRTSVGIISESSSALKRYWKSSALDICSTLASGKPVLKFICAVSMG